MSSFSNHVELRQAQIKRKQRLGATISIASFLGSTLFAVGHFLNDNFHQTSQPKPNSAATAQSQAEAEEQGYKLVLQREPNNQVALEGLVRIRIQTRNFKGAQEPLEMLVKMNPARNDYKALLAQVQKQVGDR
jgi:cytochrome c-type biogenesis protein CcmH/NrfG